VSTVKEIQGGDSKLIARTNRGDPRMDWRLSWRQA